MNFNFEHHYCLEDDVVKLIPLERTHFTFLLPFSLHEPELWMYSMVQAIGEHGLAHYIEGALEARVQQKEYPLVVWDKRTQQYAGSTRFYDIQLQNKSLQLGFTWYGKAYQGTGLNKHCKYLLLKFAFEELGIERVEFRADTLNLRSVAAMKRIGCKEEGVLRSHGLRANGTRRDSIILSILKSEWEQEVKVLIQQQLFV